MAYNPSINAGPATDDRAGRGPFGPGGGVQPPNAGTAYTLKESDSGTIIPFTSGSGIALTIPPGLGQGFEVGIVQQGAGQITVSATSPAAFNNRQSFTKTAGQYAMISLVAVAADTFILTGDGA
jgi:hypothetical protein